MSIKTNEDINKILKIWGCEELQLVFFENDITAEDFLDLTTEFVEELITESELRKKFVLHLEAYKESINNCKKTDVNKNENSIRNNNPKFTQDVYEPMRKKCKSNISKNENNSPSKALKVMLFINQIK